MAAKNIQELYDEARVIYTASTEGENTQVRIGQMFYDLIEHLYEISDVNGTVGPITPTPTPSTLGGPLLTSFNNMPIPTDPDQILHWIDSEDKWEFIDTPTGGGSGGSGDVTWLDLKTDNGSADDNKQINLSHLKNALSGYLENNLTGNNSLYSWWGQKLQKNTNTTPATYRITNAPLEGVTYIRFTNDVILGVDPSSAENTLCVYNSDLTKVGHIYATGGVSALGNSSSGGVSPTPGTPIDLRGLLSHISSSSYSPDYANATAVSNALLALPDSGAGATIRWNGSKWIVDKTIFDDIANITDNGGSFLKKEDDGYSWSDPATGTSGSTTLSGLQDTNISSLAPGQLLYYQDATDEWVNKTFAINSTASISNPVSLQNIVFGGTKYTLPAATSGTPGIMKIGNSTIQTTAANNPTTTTERTYPIQLNSDGQAVVNVPWVDTNTTYSAGNGLNPLNGGTEFSVKAASGGGLAVDITGIKIDPNTNKRVLWGNQDTLVSDIGKSGDNKSLSYVQDISMYGTIVMNTKNSQIQMADPAGITRNIINLTDKNQADVYYGNTVKAFLDIGYGCARVTTGDNKSVLRLWGNDIIFKANGLDGNKNIMILTKEGSTYLPLATTGPKEGNTYTGAGPAAGLRIGDAVLYWDEANQALALAKYNASTPSSPTAANFYATGGVSALGMSPGISSIDAMTFGVVDITSSLKIKLGNTNNKATIYTNTGTGLIIDNPYGGIFINDSATYINDAAGDTYFGGDENTDGGNIYICLASQGYEYYRLDVDKLQRDGYLTLD